MVSLDQGTPVFLPVALRAQKTPGTLGVAGAREHASIVEATHAKARGSRGGASTLRGGIVGAIPACANVAFGGAVVEGAYAACIPLPSAAPAKFGYGSGLT